MVVDLPEMMEHASRFEVDEHIDRYAEVQRLGFQGGERQPVVVVDDEPAFVGKASAQVKRSTPRLMRFKGFEVEADSPADLASFG